MVIDFFIRCPCAGGNFPSSFFYWTLPFGELSLIFWPVVASVTVCVLQICKMQYNVIFVISRCQSVHSWRPQGWRPQVTLVGPESWRESCLLVGRYGMRKGTQD